MPVGVNYLRDEAAAASVVKDIAAYAGAVQAASAVTECRALPVLRASIPIVICETPKTML